MTLIARIRREALADHLDNPEADPVWAIQFTPGETLQAFTAPAGSITSGELASFAAAALDIDCPGAHTAEPVWSGVLMETKWRFMRCPVDTLDDPALAQHPVNKGATAFIRINEAKPCPCTWHGTMIFSHRLDGKHGQRGADLMPIPFADVRNAAALAEAAR